MSSFKAQGSNLVHSLARKASIPYSSLFHFHYYALVASIPFWLLRWAPSPPSHMPALREGMRIRTCTTYARSVSKEEESKCVGRDSKASIRDRWWHVASSSSSPRRRRRRRKGARKVSVYVARMMPSPSSGLSPLHSAASSQGTQ